MRTMDIDWSGNSSFWAIYSLLRSYTKGLGRIIIFLTDFKYIYHWLSFKIIPPHPGITFVLRAFRLKKALQDSQVIASKL